MSSSSSSLSSSQSLGSSSFSSLDKVSSNSVFSSNSTVSISGGPLSYEYHLHHLLFHYGRTDDRGSEHTISEQTFPAEVQLYFFNGQLYNSWEEAVEQPNGLAAISVLVQLTKDNSKLHVRENTKVASSSPSASSKHQNPHHSSTSNAHSHNSNPTMTTSSSSKDPQQSYDPPAATSSATSSSSELKHLFHSLEDVKFKGSKTKVHKMSLSSLLPSLRHYMTYEGSLTQPSCVETVQWIISNKPLYMTPADLTHLRNTVVLEGQGQGNFRPTQPINSRSLRTNIPTSADSEEPTTKYSSTANSNVNIPNNNVYTNSRVTTSFNSNEERVNFSLNKKKLCSGRGFISYKGECH
jgi:hypothetical protein